MKLKFRAEPKDWAIFGVYAVILLYFVAIAILNLAQFAVGDVDHLFHGFSPFKAFTKGYLPITIVVYIIALVASLFSVQDRFFDMDNGFGFSFDSKREKGYSRWLSESELKRDADIKRVKLDAETADAGGVPLINNGKTMWVDDSGFHNIIIGSTGAGKSQITMFPLIKSLAKHDESMIVTDPKGELYEGTCEMLRKRGYNVVLLNFRDPQRGSGWNPLHLPYLYYKAGNKDKANELIDDLAINILYDANAQNQDPFWEKTSADYFSGICLGLFEDATEEEINLNSINMFTTVGEEKAGPNTTFVNEYFKTKDPSSPAYVSASSTLIAPTDTKGSILSVFKQKLRLFASRENISEMLSHSDFEFSDIGSKKTAVFIVIQDEKKTYHPLVTIFVKQCYEALVDYAQKSGGKLPYRTNFLLDEFANMPPLKDVETMVSAARSRKMRFFFVIQNFAQLAEVYGKNKADTIRGNCGNIIYLISTEIAALEEISKMCGEVKIKTGKGDKEKEETRPLITVSDLQKLKMGEIILLRSRTDPFRTKLKLDYQTEWGELYATGKGGDGLYPHREKQPVKVFDLKGFVNKHKEAKLNQLISGNLNKNTKTPMPSAMPNIPGFPGMGQTSNPRPKPNNGLDIDALVKKIDARIAELEEEGKKEKAELARKKGGNNGAPSTGFNPSDLMKPQPTGQNLNNNVQGPKSGSNALLSSLANLQANKASVVTPTPVKTEPVNNVIPNVPVKEEPPVVMPTAVKSEPAVNVIPDVPVKEATVVPNIPVMPDNKVVTPVVKENVNKVVTPKPVKEETKREIITPAKISSSKEKKDFASKIADRVNKKVREKENEYVSDDQFFDDFFADDDEM